MFKPTNQNACRGSRPWLRSLAMSLLGMVGLGLTAQAQVVQGDVVSALDGQPLPGVNIIVKGTTNGTISDADGIFSLTVNQGETIQASFIGFKTQEIVYQGQKLHIEMEDEASELDEVVAIGYGVQKKKLLTGASVQVKGDEVQKLNTTNPLQALQGQTPGVQITSTSGQPGSAMSVTVRGLGTVGNAQPLYLIDGVGGDITTLNPADIESIDVLKDAASCAIYGANGANGVVLVTTKKGTEGQCHVSYDGYVGFQRIQRQTEMLNAREYMAIMDEAALNSGGAPYDWKSEAMQGINGKTAEDGTVTPGNDALFDANGNPLYDTDWIDQIVQDDTKTLSHNLSIVGGGKTSTYAISIGYLKQEGMIGGPSVSNYDRYNFRANSEHKMWQCEDGHHFLTVGENVSFVWKETRGMSTGNIWNNNLHAAFSTSPLIPVYNEDGSYYGTKNSPWDVGEGNPLGNMMVNRNNRDKSGTLDASVYAQIEPIKNLKIKTIYGISFNSSEHRAFKPKYDLSSTAVNSITSVDQSHGHGISQTWGNTASYDIHFGGDTQLITVLIGQEMTKYDGSNTSAHNTDLIAGFDDWQHAYLSNTEGTDNKTVSGGPYDSTRGVSYFIRAGWNMKEKYMLNATFRADASSKFASGNRYGFFPSVSAGWTISEEGFMDGAKGAVDFLKLRVSWGKVGNSNIKCYQYTAPVETDKYQYNYGVGGGQSALVTGSKVTRLANPDIEWEKSNQFDVGVDARFLEGRLGLNIDYYIKKTEDWLVKALVLATAGTGEPFINGGDVKNTGVELALTWQQQHDNGIKWNVGFNFAYNKNKVGDIPNGSGIIEGESNQIFDSCLPIYRAQNDHAIGYFRGLKTDGIFQNEQEIQDWIAAGNGVFQTNLAPGDVKFVDQNHDGLINDDDKVDLGCGIPKANYGVNLGFAWKGIDVSLVGTGASGFKICQSLRSPTNGKQNYTKRILDRWHGEGTSNEIPRVLNGDNGNWGQFSDLYLQDGDYFRLQNITVGYDFKQLIKWKYLSQLRVYFQCQNVATWTKYDGMDPEIGSYNGTDGNSSDTWVSGVDMGYYPHPRTMLVGLNLKF